MSEDKKYIGYLIIRSVKTREEIDRVGLTSLNENHVERVMLGLLRNMGEDYYVDDSECRPIVKEQDF